MVPVSLSKFKMEHANDLVYVDNMIKLKLLFRVATSKIWKVNFSLIESHFLVQYEVLGICKDSPRINIDIKKNKLWNKELSSI